MIIPACAIAEQLASLTLQRSFEVWEYFFFAYQISPFQLETSKEASAIQYNASLLPVGKNIT